MGKLKVALVLGGGAARGLAHLGALRVFEKEQVPIDMIVGTSMGAVVGAMYAADPHIEPLIDRARTFLGSEEFSESRIHDLKRGEDEQDQSWLEHVSGYLKKAQVISSTVRKLSYFDSEEVRGFFSRFVDDLTFDELKIPFCAVASDLNSGEQVVLDQGSILDAACASSAIPGAFPPVKIGERYLIDGGIVNMVPVTVAIRRGADFIIAMNVSHELPHPRELKRALEVYFRSHEITKRILIAHQLKFADIVVTPSHVQDIHWADFSEPDVMLEAGEKAAEEAMPAIYAKYKQAKRPRFFKRKKVSLGEMIP